ncbi:hypothetical protein BCR34DRAFT_290678 [Clohesyomyces aquaticus]|uniref:Ricin B lectin domain-containing protein n=1 Tax=Clohesyomyces aquaticus TaxID=1231657 RepID=A0A1Y1ZQY3_9PLEO|nr:hypothetical protein BCR34DRAFT_290678 [Clohesyomyces aquaticus]
MLTTALLALALAATGLSQTMKEGYRKVYITSMVDPKFVVVPKTPVKSGTTLVVQTLTSKPEQQWYIKEGVNVTIQLAGTTLCLDGGAKTNWKDMGSIYVKDCSETEVAQKWNVMADGRIALVASSPQECIDLQYMRATANNPVGLYACAGLGNTGAKDKGINWPLVNATTF